MNIFTKKVLDALKGNINNVPSDVWRIDLHGELFVNGAEDAFTDEDEARRALEEWDVFKCIQCVVDDDYEEYGETMTSITPIAIANVMVDLIGKRWLEVSETYRAKDGERLSVEDVLRIGTEMMDYLRFNQGSLSWEIFVD